MNRWKMNRAKVFNFWYYTDQEFFMESGRALFRGHNGSGKSVTTQALITVLLDGNANSYRLDPFGKTERNIRDTVLGENDILGLEDRIGYVTMEFKKGNAEVYKTIGMGVEAHRGNSRATKQWYFILHGKRVGNHDGHFRLYKEEKIDGKRQKVPLSAKELEEALEREGASEFFDHRDDYADQVNKQLFGFETMESYQNYIKLLINTRSPKLSDTTNTNRLSEVLTESLPPIPEEEIRPLFETFESIERMERVLAAYKTDLSAMTKLESAYRKYHAQALAEKAVEYRNAMNKLSGLEKKRRGLVQSIAGNTSKVLKRMQIVEKLENKHNACLRERATLYTEELSQLQATKDKLISELKDANKQLEKLRGNFDSSKKETNKHQRHIEDLEHKISKAQKESNETIEELQELAEECFFEANETCIQHFMDTEDHYSFKAWLTEFEDYSDFLNETKMILQKHERLIKDSETAKQALGDVQYKFDLVEGNVIRINGELEQAELALIVSIQEWHAELQELSLSDEEVHRLLAGVARADIVPHETYMKEIQESYNVSHQRLVESELEAKQELKDLATKIQQINEDIDKLRSQPEMEPTIINRKRKDWLPLIQEGIPYVPFYEAYEFKDGVPESTRLRIQDGLSELGILAAVIVPEDKIEIASKHASVVLPVSKKELNLTAYLNPVSDNELDITLIERVLEGISINEDAEHYVSEHGHFRTEWLEGRATSFEEGLFIGKGAREALRLVRIETLQDTLDDLIDMGNTLQLNMEHIGVRKERLALERGQFPSLDGYRELGNEKRLACLTLENLKSDLEQKREHYQQIEREATALLTSLRKDIRFPNISLNLDSFTTAVKAAKAYLKQLGRLERTYNDQQNDKKLVLFHRYSQQQEQDRSGDLWEQICNEDLQITAMAQDLKNTEEALQAIGENEVLQRLEKLSHLVGKIPKTRDVIRDNINKMKHDSESRNGDLIELEGSDIPFQSYIVAAWKFALDEHRKLDVYHDEKDVDVSEIPFDQALTYLLEKIADMHDVNRNNINKSISYLQKAFDIENVNLLQYSLARETVRSEFFEMHHLDNLTDDQQTIILSIHERLGRIDIKANMVNKRISPASVCSYLDGKIVELTSQVGEKDRELYEQFLMNTLRDSIRQKIHYVRNWEKEINRFLNEGDMIRFRLKWVPRERDSEEELNTKELVEALSRDQQWIDKNTITKHFRAKIKQAKRSYEENREGSTNLRTLIADVMDYRKWHDFELYFTKPGGNETLLTRKSVSALSGGQQVLSVVAPILAALHAKYLEANVDTVRIFTLDEAFSRVDDDNKEAMFKYIRNLDFDYIINSQELWGTYATVPELDIFELARPKNRPAVSVIAYHWNGITSVKTRIKPEEKLVAMFSDPNE